MRLTDQQWKRLAPLLTDINQARYVKQGDREILNAIFWKLGSREPWTALPAHYPYYQSCQKQMKKWVDEGVMSDLLESIAIDLHIQGDLDLKGYLTKREQQILLIEIHPQKGSKLWSEPFHYIFNTPETQKLLEKTKADLVRILKTQDFLPVTYKV